MSKLTLIAACATAALSLGACSYNDDYNKEGYNAANTDYSAESANYAGNEAGYGNASGYNAVNGANATDNIANGTAANTTDNMATNNSY